MKTCLFIVIMFTAALSAAAQTDIHSVDFKNFTYPAYCAAEEPQKLSVKNGEYSKETKQDGYYDRTWFKINSITYGDLNGNGNDEAIILAVCNTGGSGFFSEGFIYWMRGNAPVLVDRIGGGDRAFGGLVSAKVDKGLLLVERNDAGEDGAACCPQFIETTRYKLVSGKLVEVGKPDKRPFVDTEVITFDRGKSGKTFTATLSAGETKRYSVNGRAGQKLTVTVDNSDVSIHADTTAFGDVDVNSYSIKLPTSGDFEIELRNEVEKDSKVTVTIKIQ